MARAPTYNRACRNSAICPRRTRRRRSAGISTWPRSRCRTSRSMRWCVTRKGRLSIKRPHERMNESHKRIQALSRAAEGNGKGLDKAVLDSALDDLIKTFEDARKLDDLLVKAKQ